MIICRLKEERLKLGDKNRLANVSSITVSPVLIEIECCNGELLQFNVLARRGVDKAEPERHHVTVRSVERQRPAVRHAFGGQADAMQSVKKGLTYAVRIVNRLNIELYQVRARSVAVH